MELFKGRNPEVQFEKNFWELLLSLPDLKDSESLK